MTPGLTLLILTWVGCVVAGYFLGKYKGQVEAGLILTILLGLLGLVIVACLPRSRQAKVAAAQRQYEIQAEAARRAGYPYPPQPPYPQQPYPQQPYPPYPPQVQQPYPQQPPPGQWQPPPPAGSGEQPYTAPWPGTQP